MVAKIKTYFSFFLLFCACILSAYTQTDSLLFIPRDVLDYQQIKPTNDLQNMKVVSASRYSKNVTDIPVTVYVVTRDEILKNGYITLVDVLKSLPGMKTSQPHCGESGEGFTMRGLLGNYYSKILINNIPIQPSVLSGLPIGSNLPIRQAERIEFIYGPASSLYGADATVGVINIVTKNSDVKNYAEADIVTGTNGFNYMNFMVGGKAGQGKKILQYNFYGNQMEFRDMNIVHTKNNVYHPLHYLEQYSSTIAIGTDSANYFLIAPTELNDELLRSKNINDTLVKASLMPRHYIGSISNPVINNLSQAGYALGATLNYSGFRFSYDLMYSKMHASVGRSPFLFRFDNPNNFIGNKIYRTTLGYDKAFVIGKKERVLHSATNLSYLRYRMDNSGSLGVTYVPDAPNQFIYAASDDISFEQIFNISPLKNLNLTTGFSFQESGNLPQTNQMDIPFDVNLYKPFSTDTNYKHPKYGTFGYNPIKYSSRSNFFQLDYTWRKFNFLLSYRKDTVSLYQKTTKPRYAIMYKLNDKISFRVSEGFAYKTPSSTMRYYAVQVPSQRNKSKDLIAFLPNPSLQPEEFVAHELGVRYFPKNNIFTDFAIYYNVVKDMIYSVTRPLDYTKFPNADSIEDQYRFYINSSKAIAKLLGAQLSIKANNLIESIQLSPSLHVNYLIYGEEILPDSAKTEIKTFRGVPKYMVNANLSCSPKRNTYIRVESIVAGSWTKQFVVNAEDYKTNKAKVKGYFNLDMVLGYNINKYLTAYTRITNLLNSEYGGIDGSGVDTNMPYNPQLKRNIRFGVTFKWE